MISENFKRLNAMMVPLMAVVVLTAVIVAVRLEPLIFSKSSLVNLLVGVLSRFQWSKNV